MIESDAISCRCDLLRVIAELNDLPKLSSKVAWAKSFFLLQIRRKRYVSNSVSGQVQCLWVWVTAVPLRADWVRFRPDWDHFRQNSIAKYR